MKKTILIAVLTATAFSNTPAIADNKAAPASKGVAYVANQDGGLMVIDLDSMEVKASIDIGAKGPRGIGVTADGKWLITANKEDSNISIIDTSGASMPRYVSIGKPET